MKKYLLINPFGIGDVLFTTPLINALKEADPTSVISYWCNQRVQDILKHHPQIDKVFSLSRGDIKKLYAESKIKGIGAFFKLFGQIKKENFDVALDFSLDHRYGLIAKLIGIKKRIGFNYKNRGRFLTDKIDIEGYADKHVVEYYLDLLQFLDITAKNPHLELFLPLETKVRARYFLLQHGIKHGSLTIGMSCGGGQSWGKDAIFKHWSAQNYGALAQEIMKLYGRAQILILGDKSEQEIANLIIRRGGGKMLDLTGRTNLEELMGIINEIDLLIANDSGPLHIAVALGKKTISFFGPVDERVYGPYPSNENKHIVLSKNIDCRPCYGKFRFAFCAKSKACLEAISVEETLQSVIQQLSQK